MVKTDCLLGSFRFSILVLLIGLGALAVPHGSARAETHVKQKLVLGLPDLIQMAIAKSPEIGATLSETEVAQSDLKQVKAAYYPQVQTRGLVGPADDASEPVIRDNKIYDPSPDLSLSSIGIFGRLDMTAVQPLYTFGKLSNRKEAADRAVRAKEFETERKRNEIELRVTQLYYALILARMGISATDEADDFFEDARRRISRLLDMGVPTVAESDLYRVDAFRSDNIRSRAEARKGLEFAHFALKKMLRLPPDQEFEVLESPLTLREKELDDLQDYVQKALTERPEFRQLHEAMEAQKNQVQAARSDRYPSFFLAFEGSLAGAPGRDRLDNPYIPDEFNHAYAALVTGMEWDFDFGIKGAIVDKAASEYKKLLHTKEAAEMNIPIQVAKSYQEILEWKASAVAYQKAAVASRKWTVAAMTEFDMGVGTADNMLRAIEKYGHNQGSYIQALFNYHTAIAELEYAIGMKSRLSSGKK
jgi:outer membrane protein TolC